MNNSSVKHAGKDAVLYKAAKGALVTSGAFTNDSWYKIKALASVGSALPALAAGSLFKTPYFISDKITLAVGDEVYPITLTEVCKTDCSISGEMGVLDTTDSCDYPYNSSIPDGFTKLSGSLNTMMRFDEETDALIPLTVDFLTKFYDIVDDDGNGSYTLTEKDDSDIILMIVLNKDSIDVVNKIQNWLIIPAILKSAATNVALKDALKADFSWEKGQGPASVYRRTTPATS